MPSIGFCPHSDTADMHHGQVGRRCNSNTSNGVSLVKSIDYNSQSSQLEPLYLRLEFEFRGCAGHFIGAWGHGSYKIWLNSKIHLVIDVLGNSIRHIYSSLIYKKLSCYICAILHDFVQNR